MITISFVLSGLLGRLPHGGGVTKMDFPASLFRIRLAMCTPGIETHKGRELHFTSSHGLQGKSNNS